MFNRYNYRYRPGGNKPKVGAKILIYNIKSIGLSCQLSHEKELHVYVISMGMFIQQGVQSQVNCVVLVTI